MNVTKTISIVVLAAGMSWAQAAKPSPAATTKKPAAKTTTTAAKPASQMAPAAAKTKPMAKPVAKAAPVGKPAPVGRPAPMKSVAPVKAAKTVAPKPAPKASTAKSVKPAKPAVKPVAAVSPTQRAESLTKPIGKRDPFVSVIVARSDSSAACSGGKRCLVIDQLALRGIVRTPTKWIALVENPAKKTYYLYENDPIYNAVVVRITGDSVIFREQVMDALGHATEREVVKRVSAPAI
ncbi:MAG: hypothetical protein ACJ71N_11550 [Terriglobales bacterium]|jgi:hypothetical protein